MKLDPFRSVKVTTFYCLTKLWFCGFYLISGKTTILYRFKLNETVNTLPTIGFNVETLTPMKGLTLTVWDMGGQERMRPLWKMYLRGTDGNNLPLFLYFEGW